MLQTIFYGILTLIIITLLVKAFPYALALGFIGLLCWLTYTYWQIAIPVWIIVVVAGVYYDKKEIERIRAWKNTIPDPLRQYDIDNFISSIIDEHLETDNNTLKDYIFIYSKDKNNIPYGRANAFLNFFKKSIDDVTVFYFSVIPSRDTNELREYGLLIASDGIYISIQKEKSVNDDNSVNDVHIPFSGLDSIVSDIKKLEVKYIEHDSDRVKSIKINQEDITLPIKTISNICTSIKNTTLPSVIYNNIIIKDYENNNNIDKNFKTNKTITDLNRSLTLGTITGSNENFKEVYNENKNLMDGARGQGYAAEYANITIDRVNGRNVVNTAQILDENGRQVKNGSDRIVNGEEIQTKYYKTASESIGAAFENNQAKYISADGKMMVIEVPRDQYPQALEQMQKRIDKGEVPGAKPGDSPESYVRKGVVTYNEACNIAKAGTVESLSIDIISGIVSSSFACGISGTIIFAASIWHGKNIKEAAQIALVASLKNLGKSVLIYTVTMQLSRGQIANPFVQTFTKDGIKAGLAGFDNPIALFSNNLATKISQSSLAKTSLGESLGLRVITGRSLISGTIIGVIVFGPDIVRAMRGRISKQQLCKNSAVGASGLAGAAIGQTLIPVPVLGAIVGATISSLVVKKTLDQFVDDDNIKMFQIFKEEFLESSMLNALTQDEFNALADETVGNKKLSDILINMYASGEPRKYASEFMNANVIALLKKRKKVQTVMLNEGIEEYILEAEYA